MTTAIPSKRPSVAAGEGASNTRRMKREPSRDYVALLDRCTPLIRAALETDIIPRLYMAHTETGDGRTALDLVGDARPTNAEVEAFMGQTRAGEMKAAMDLILDLRARGASQQTILFDLMAPAARRLGDLWCRDEVDFAEVTLAVSRMHSLVHELRPCIERPNDFRRDQRRILLAPAPGEQHSFGLLMVEDMFWRAGWDVTCDLAMTSYEIIQAVASTPYTVVGLSISCESLMDGLVSVIRKIRRTSMNSGIGVLVGGAIFRERPDLALQVGADAAVVHGRQAVRQSTHVLGMVASPG